MMKRLACLAVVLLSVVTALATDASAPLRIGSKRFTESYILAQLLAQAAAPQLAQAPQVKQGLGNTAIVYEALRSGSIDLYPEYAGTIALEILKSSAPMSLDAMNRALAPLGLGAAIPLGFNDGYALALRGADAARLGIRTLSDLARHPELRLGLSNEFIGRADGWPGLAQRYGFKQRPTGLDHGLAYDAIAAGQIDVMDIYTTDARIAHLGLAVLQDDRNYFPRYDALVLYRLDVPQRFPPAWKALQALQGRIDEASMIAMNARAELQGVAFDAIARDWLARTSNPTQAGAHPAFAARLFGPDLGRLTAQHLGLVVVSVLLAALVAIPLGVLSFPHPRTRALLLGMTGLLQTVPSLALLAALIWLLGVIGVVPALVALTLYALLPIMRNCVTGLGEVPDGLRDAATALGMTNAQRLRSIELPLALPTVLAGIRIATSIGIGTATIAAFIGAGGFGERIVTGLALNDGELMLAGAIPAAALALASEALFELSERWLRRRRGA
jgi:osmoprotectant transport system permease protein